MSWLTETKDLINSDQLSTKSQSRIETYLYYCERDIEKLLPKVRIRENQLQVIGILLINRHTPSAIDCANEINQDHGPYSFLVKYSRLHEKGNSIKVLDQLCNYWRQFKYSYSRTQKLRMHCNLLLLVRIYLNVALGAKMSR